MTEQSTDESESQKTQKLPAELRYLQYEHGLERKYLPSIRALMKEELSEPYSIYVYRYFLYQWGDLCFMVFMALANLQGAKTNSKIGTGSTHR
jgi:peptide alpha-N-acetyltransferase